jgi:hypothetical protein
MVSILLNLAYVRQTVAKSFQFKPDFSRTFGKEMSEAKLAYES